MIVGLDFDNTIVTYEKVFHEVALNQGYITDDVAQSKVAVRDNLRAQGKEDVWTALQGYVYGTCMSKADIFPGVIEALKSIKNDGHITLIISHKTRYPFAGPKYDLRNAARTFIDDVLRDGETPLIPLENISFLETKDEKLSHIQALGCDVYLDDLPEILMSENFPNETKKFLFNPENYHKQIDGVTLVSSWNDFVVKLYNDVEH